MKLTKYGHACVVLEEQGQRLIIDPGSFTPEFGDITYVAAIVVTHVHSDHLNPDHLNTILAANPKAPIFTTQEVADSFKHPNVSVVTNGQIEQVGQFTLRFSGEKHQVIHASIPQNLNTAVLVNDRFFYPGDSFTLPQKPVELLAVPANAPWTNSQQTIDYIVAAKARQCIPTHNGLLSEYGHTVYNYILTHGCELSSSTFTYLQPGESIDF